MSIETVFDQNSHTHLMSVKVRRWYANAVVTEASRMGIVVVLPTKDGLFSTEIPLIGECETLALFILCAQEAGMRIKFTLLDQN